MELGVEKSLQMYQTMLTIRGFELKLAELFAAGEIPGFIHLCVGQEATATGVGAVLRVDDYVVSNHRGHGHILAKGADLNLVAAEIFGRKAGYCGGKGGSMHVSAIELGILGANGIVGGGLPIATGAAFSAKYKNTDQITVCFFGDGATGEGTFHEAMNMAALWNLPIIFLCENNGWAEFTPQSTHMNISQVTQRALAYNMNSVNVDGSDVTEVYHAVNQAAQRARAGGGPSLIECKTHRWRGHYEGDPQHYRPAESVEDAFKHDSIAIFEEKLVAQGILEADQAEKIKAEVSQNIEQAIQFARESEWPLPEDTLQGVYS